MPKTALRGVIPPQGAKSRKRRNNEIDILK